jgi:hypothetical protein
MINSSIPSFQETRHLLKEASVLLQVGSFRAGGPLVFVRSGFGHPLAV